MIRLTGFFWILLAGAVFGVIHSTLASNGVKTLAARMFGEKSRKYYRLGFVLLATLMTFAYLSLVILLPDRLIYLIPTPWVYLTLLIQLSALGGIILSFGQINTSDFLGINVLTHSRYAHSGEIQPKLVTGGFYRRVRHPIYTCTILFLIFFPGMSWNLLALTIGITVYMLVGAIFEEKKMVQTFAADYVEYRNKTPMFLPMRKK